MFDDVIQDILRSRFTIEEGAIDDLLIANKVSRKQIKDGEYHLVHEVPKSDERVLPDFDNTNDTVTFKFRKAKFTLYKKIDEVEV